VNPVKQIQNQAIAAYSSKPVLIRQHYNQEQKERQGYCKRPLLELLQNIEDALNNPEKVDTDKPQALFCLDETTLWIANKGKNFDQRGFQSLCDSDDSPKHGKGFIGSKGTGFKAILNWTNTPEVYSGDIHARFNRDETESIIRKSISPHDYDDLKEDGGWRGRPPLLRVPLDAEPDKFTKQLLGDGWNTVIKLPLFSEAIENVSNKLESFDPVNLLFLRHLNRVEFRLPDTNTFLVACTPRGIDKFILSKGNDEPVEYELYREPLPDIQPKNQKELGGSCEIAVAYKANASESNTKPYPLFNFFPIRNALAPFNGLLIHATFLLKADRDDLSEDDPEFHQGLTRHIAEMLAKSVIPSMVRKLGAECLHLLKILEHNGTEHIKSIHDELHAYIRNIPFIPDLAGKQSAPPGLYRWKWELGNLLQEQGLNSEIDNLRLCAPDWQEGHKDVLQQFGMTELENLGHIKALEHIKPSSSEDAIKALLIVDQAWCKDAAEIVRGLPLWQKQSGEFRPLADNQPFFEKPPPHTRNQDMPDWLHFDVLHPDFRKTLEKRKLWNSLKSKLSQQWFKPGSKDSLLEHAILPVLNEKSLDWWQQRGKQVLTSLEALELSADNELIQKGSLRSKIAKAIHVPGLDGDWQPAGKVYASKGWYRDEPAWGEALATCEDRFLLVSPECFGGVNPGDSALVNLLRYIGVSWYPKLVNGDGGIRLCPFSGTRFKAEWESYVDKIKPDLSKSNKEYEASHSGNRIETDSIKAWGLEGINLIQDIKADHASILLLFRKLFDDTLKTEISRRGPSGGYRPSFTPKTSFLAWQLRHAPVFSVDKTSAVLSGGVDAESASSMFMEPSGGWKGWLPTIDLSHVGDEAQRDELRAFAYKDLSALYRVQDAPQQLWLEWLKRIKSIYHPDDQTIVKPLKAFMSDFGKVLSGRNNFDPSILKGLDYPCETNNGIRFVKVNDLFILDEYKWEPIKPKLLESERLLLLADYEGGKKLAYLLGLETRLLSEALALGLTDELKLKLTDNMGTDIDKTRFIEALLTNKEKRARILALVAHSVPTKAEKMRDDWHNEVQVVNHLKVALSLEEKPLGDIVLPFYWNENLLYLNGSDNIHQALAKAMVEQFALANELEDALTNVIREADQSITDADQYLRGKNISEEDVKHWLETDAAPPPQPSSASPETEAKTAILKDTNSKTHHTKTGDHPTKPKSKKNIPSKQVRHGSSTSRGSTGGGRPSPEKGRNAEQWLQQCLREKLYGWALKDISHEHSHGKEADILLSKGDKKIFIEVKHSLNYS